MVIWTHFRDSVVVSLLGFSVAFLTSEAGLSLAFGAFIAGLIVSESEYSHQATSFILPFEEARGNPSASE